MTSPCAPSTRRSGPSTRARHDMAPGQTLADFAIVARLAGVSLAADDIHIEALPAPHAPPKPLPAGQMAVYVFHPWRGCAEGREGRDQEPGALHKPALQSGQRAEHPRGVHDRRCRAYRFGRGGSGRDWELDPDERGSGQHTASSQPRRSSSDAAGKLPAMPPPAALRGVPEPAWMRARLDYRFLPMVCGLPPEKWSSLK